MKQYTADILVPAYNEEALVGRTLRSIANQHVKRGWHFRVHIIANGCTDNTLQVVEQALAELQKDSHFEYVVHNLPEASKIKALQYGFERTVAPLIFCIDSDSILGSNCFIATLEAFKDPKIMVAGPMPQVMVLKDQYKTLLGYMHRTGNICRRMYEGMAPGGTMIGYRRKHIAGYPDNVASDDTFIAFSMAQRFGWKSVRVLRDAVVYWVGPQNWVDYIKQESRFARATTQLLERFPEFIGVREAQKSYLRHAERSHAVAVRFAMKRAGLPLACLGYHKFWQRLCAENADFLPSLITADGRWETILTTKHAPEMHVT